MDEEIQIGQLRQDHKDKSILVVLALKGKIDVYKDRWVLLDDDLNITHGYGDIILEKTILLSVGLNE